MSEHLTAEEIEAEVYDLPVRGDPARPGAHLRDCTACGAVRDRFRQERSLLEGAVASISMPPEFGDRLAARIPSPARQKRAGALALAAPAWVAVAALGLLVLHLSVRVNELKVEVRLLSTPPSGSGTLELPAPVRVLPDALSVRFVGLHGPASQGGPFDPVAARKPLREDAGAPVRMLPSLTRLMRPPAD
ncbi:MAG TPA: hypothetical protein VMU54_15315 [Planctomycetota bacterium]|nr:hypothetical protein [Planctomycetota bacterium]